MPRLPKLLTHSQGFFFVRVTGPDGKRHDYNFGRDRQKAEYQYNQFIAELCQNRNNPQPVRARVSLSMDELVVQYLESIRGRYEPTNSFTDYRKAGELLGRTYGKSPVSSFTIPHFQKLIREMISHGWALRTINVRIGFIKQFFKYALDCDLVTAEQFFKIKSVPRIRRDDIRVKPERVVPPVEVDVVQRTLPYFSPMVADMVKVQLHSGMRAGELCRLNWAEIDRSGTVWMYRPSHHKNEWRGTDRTIPIGPQARGVPTRHFEEIPSDQDYLFTPKGKTRPYRMDSYGHAIRKAAKRAGVNHWFPYQLRHTRATEIRKRHGIEGSQVILGHATIDATQIYAEQNRYMPNRTLPRQSTLPKAMGSR